MHELAPAKVNLVLHVGPRRADGLHEVSSLIATLELADHVWVDESPAGEDQVTCRGVEEPNLVATALATLREATDRSLPPLRVTIEKRIPVAAGLGGGSADAAAVLRAANEMIGRPLDADGLREVGAQVGADVPGQVDPRHALVAGAGEAVEPVHLPAFAVVLVPQERGLRAGEVYAEADRLATTRPRLDEDDLRRLVGASLHTLGSALENDLEAAARSLRPELAEPLLSLEAAGAIAALVSGSGPTVFGVFPNLTEAEAAAARIPGSIVSAARQR